MRWVKSASDVGTRRSCVSATCVKRLGPFTALNERFARREAEASSSAFSALRLRQDHAAARHRRASTRRTQARSRSAGRDVSLPAAGRPRLRHRVPVLRAVPEPHRGGQNVGYGLVNRRAGRAEIDRRVSPNCWSWSAWRSSGDEVSGAALRRPAAAASRWRARWPRRRGYCCWTSRCRRSTRSVRRAPARRDQAPAAPPRRHHHHGDARPGGGAGDGRPHRGVMNHGVIEQVGTPAGQIYRDAATALRCRLRRHHDVPRRRDRRFAALRVGSIELASPPRRSGFASGTPVRIGLRPEEIRVRNIDATTPNQYRERALDARLPRLSSAALQLEARGSAERRDPSPTSRLI